MVWDEAETRGGKRRGADLFERRRQLCDQVVFYINNFSNNLVLQHTMESQRDGPKEKVPKNKNSAIKN